MALTPDCVPNPAGGPGTGEINIVISPSGAATVTIAGVGSFTQSTLVSGLADNSTYAVTITAGGGFVLSASSATSGNVGIIDCSTEVLGTTVTTAPAEVSADTLPFTGFESGDTVKLGLLALLAGALMLFAARGPKEEEAIAPAMGSWSNL